MGLLDMQDNIEYDYISVKCDIANIVYNNIIDDVHKKFSKIPSECIHSIVANCVENSLNFRQSNIEIILNNKINIQELIKNAQICGHYSRSLFNTYMHNMMEWILTVALRYDYPHNLKINSIDVINCIKGDHDILMDSKHNIDSIHKLYLRSSQVGVLDRLNKSTKFNNINEVNVLLFDINQLSNVISGLRTLQPHNVQHIDINITDALFNQSVSTKETHNLKVYDDRFNESFEKMLDDISELNVEYFTISTCLYFISDKRLYQSTPIESHINRLLEQRLTRKNKIKTSSMVLKNL